AASPLRASSRVPPPPCRWAVRAPLDLRASGQLRALAFLKAGNDLDDRARPVATVELRADQLVPAVAARPDGSGQRIDHGAPRETCAGSRLQGGNADGLVRDAMTQHGEAPEVLL